MFWASYVGWLLDGLATAVYAFVLVPALKVTAIFFVVGLLMLRSRARREATRCPREAGRLAR